jgi:hypothetical protein
LALTHILTGAVRLVRAQRHTRLCWVHLLWVPTLVFYVFVIWFDMSWWRPVPLWHFEGFLFLALYAPVLIIQASILLPHQSGCTDFQADFSPIADGSSGCNCSP